MMQSIRQSVPLMLLLVTATSASAQARREIHFPDLPDYLTLKCDFHMHTVFSDGQVWPTVRVEEAWRQGLDAIALTDHIEYQPHKDDLPTNYNRPFDIAANMARERDLLLIRGAEITRATPPGHHNAIFLNDVNPLNVEDFYEVFQQAADQNAFVFWNHPGWHGIEKGQWGEHQETTFKKGQLHGIEVCNEDDYFAYAHQYAIDRDLTMVCNSDQHAPFSDAPFTPENHRNITLVFAKERSLPALRDALMAGRTAMWFKNRLIGREALLAPMFDACVEVCPPHYSTDRHVWTNVVNHSELDIELERRGTVGPQKITLPARSTTLLRLERADLEPGKSLDYDATNFVTAPDAMLKVTLTVPEPTVSRAPDGNRTRVLAHAATY